MSGPVDAVNEKVGFTKWFIDTARKYIISTVRPERSEAVEGADVHTFYGLDL